MEHNIFTDHNTATPQPPMLLHPGATLGQYQLIRELGRGGMGAVYLARDTRLGRRVAIKFLAHDNPALTERFLAEARVTARCKHDNIVDIYDIGEAPGHSYMVLEYLQGVTLREWLCDRWRPRPPGGALTDDDHGLVPARVQPYGTSAIQVSPTLAVEMMVPVVRALDHAHVQGLVHRDLKPENIMLTDDGSIKVLDFGIAKVLAHAVRSALSLQISVRSLTPIKNRDAADAHTNNGTSMLWAQRGFQTRASTLIGTLPYMSPEQWGTGDIDARADIWSLGILLWELCTGRHPLDPLTSERMQSIQDVTIPMPSLADKRPQLGTLAGIIDRCLRKRAGERIPSAQALLAEMEPLLPGRGRRFHGSSDEPDNPYVGLAAFQRTDAERFFGRERDISSMMGRLRNHRLITVAGPSGAGKSSFIRAGVIPALERSGQTWETFIVRPGRQPLSALADVLAHMVRDAGKAPHSATLIPLAQDGIPDAGSHNALIDTLRTQPGYLGTVLRAHCYRRHGRVLLFVDQFEELYTLGADRETREAFVRCLEGVADDASSPLRVVLAVRSDFVDRVAEDRAFTSEIMRGITLLSPLSREQLHAVLVEPLAAAGGHGFESDDLVETMLDTLQATRSPLPLLQFTAARLWEARDLQRKCVSKRSYEEMGGIEGALASHADAVLTGLSAVEQKLARLVFTALVSDERTRAIISLGELRASVGAMGHAGGADSSDPLLDRVVRHLAQARLVLMETDSERGATVELIHESLIERWPKLVHWLDEDQDAEQFRSRLRFAARQWHRQDRTEDLLWRGQSADEAERWLTSSATTLTELGARDQAYLRAVVGLHRRARQRRRQLAAAGVTLLVVIVVVVSVLALRAESQAVVAQNSAVKARAYAAQAHNATRMARAREHQSDPTKALAWIREMEPVGPTGQLPPRWSELARWAMYQDIALVILNHSEAVYSAAFSPDGARIVTASRDDTVRVWHADGTGQPILLSGHEDIVKSATFSPDGSRIVTAARDRTARVWNADGSGQPIVLSGHQDGVSTAVFSPDGTRIVTASRDKTARVWNADGSGQPIVLSGHSDGVYSAAFSPDGTRIVTASRDKTARVWNADGSGRPIVLSGHDSGLYAASFSPDGSRIVTASRDKTARVWNADGTGQPIILSGHQNGIYSAAFSPDGTRIVTASSDKSARVWNADGSGRPIVLTGHQDGIYSAAFSPRGAHIITASFDRTARVWRADGTDQPIVLHGHRDAVTSAAFSPDGNRVVTTSWDKTAQVRRADGTGRPVVLTGHRDGVYSAAFSPDGTRIVTASRDHSARVWNADGTGEPIALMGHGDSVYAAAFSPDGTRIVTASFDKTVRIWSADGTGEVHELTGHSDGVYAAAFSPDGTRIVSASFDKTVRIWSVDGVAKPIVLTGHRDVVKSAAFSPDGARILTTSYDKTARVWSLEQRTADGTPKVIELVGHESVLNASGTGGGGAFSPDGALVVTISDDETVRVWNTSGAGRPAVLRIPELDAQSVAFSRDGTRIVTASHNERNPATGKMEYWATIWPSFKRFTGISDPSLWVATSYCPPVAMRVELLGMPEDLARRQLQSCRDRVAEARSARP